MESQWWLELAERVRWTCVRAPTRRLVERQAALLAASDATEASDPSPEAVAAMEEVGLRCGRGLLRGAPPWLAHFVGEVALFMKAGYGPLYTGPPLTGLSTCCLT